MQGSVFIATSLDGFIARENGGIDWLPQGDAAAGEDYGYHAFMKDIDAMVMGRNTFELVKNFPSWPYGKTPVIVLTSRDIDIPATIAKTVETMRGSPEQIVARLEERGVRRAYIDGGVTIQRFLEAGAIQRIIITRIPILLGAGIPLFGSLSRDVRLTHIETRSWPTGLVQSEYIVTG
jgi:dihydrofolate reductase